MKFLRVVLILLLVFLLAGCNTVVSSDIAKEVLNTLSSEKYQGRLTGSRGNADVGSYLAYIYKKIGLQPLEDDGYYWIYEQKIYDPELSNIEITLIYSDGKKEKLVPGTDFFVNPTCGGINETFSVAKNIFELTDSSKILLTENISEIRDLKYEPRVIFKRVDSITLLWGETNNDPIVFSISNNTFYKIKEDNINSISIFNKDSEKTAAISNIVGYIPGKNHNKAVILSAHYDAAGNFGNIYINGAYDNASGVAVMLAIANELRAGRLDSDIVFCAFNGEEQGLKGSETAVKKLKTIYPEMYNINIDCIGVEECGDISLGNQGEAYNKQLVTDIKESLSKYRIPYNDELCLTSDHHSFNAEFIPNVSITQKKLTDIAHSKRDTPNIVDIKQLELVKNAILDFIRLNNGKMYVSENTGNPFDNMELMEAISNKARKLRESLNLEFDEGYTFKVQDLYVSTTGNRPITDMAMLKKYYPNFKITDAFYNCTLWRIIFNGEEMLLGLDPTSMGTNPNGKELESRYKIDINKIYSAIFQYYSNNNRAVQIEIYKSMTRNESFSFKRLNGELSNYELFGEPGSGKYYGFIYSDKSKGVKVTFGNKTDNGYINPQLQDEKTIIKLIKELKIENRFDDYEMILGINSNENSD